MTASRPPKVLAGPPCDKCGGGTRLLRIEPHRRFKRRHVWTVECNGCGTVHTIQMPMPRRPH